MGRKAGHGREVDLARMEPIPGRDLHIAEEFPSGAREARIKLRRPVLRANKAAEHIVDRAFAGGREQGLGGAADIIADDRFDSGRNRRIPW